MVQIQNKQRVKNIVVDALSISPLNGNQETTQKSTYQKEILSEINYIEEIPEDDFNIHFKTIQQYQWAEPSLMAKYKDGTHHKFFFF